MGAERLSTRGRATVWANCVGAAASASVCRLPGKGSKVTIKAMDAIRIVLARIRPLSHGETKSPADDSTPTGLGCYTTPALLSPSAVLCT